MWFSLVYLNCTSTFTIYVGIYCRLIISLNRTVYKYGFFKTEKLKLSRLWCCSSSHMCHIDQEKCGSSTSEHFLQCSSDHVVISQYLKVYGPFQIKVNLDIFTLFATFLAALLSSTKNSETHCSKTVGVFVSILWMKITLMI